MVISLFLLTLGLYAQGDPRSLRLMGTALVKEWGQSDDGEDLYFRGNFYGIRAKLILSQSTETHLVTSAYVTIGPYSTEAMLTKNLQYFLYKLQKEHGEFSQRDDSYYFIDDFGSVKLSIADNGNGSRDIRVFYFPNSAFYKDAVCMGFHGPVQEVVTENAVAEEQFMHFMQNGQLENPDLTHRQYNRFGYLVSAQMTEQTGHSMVQYEYDDDFRLKRRILTNVEANITYVNEYGYNEQGDLVFQQNKEYETSLTSTSTDLTSKATLLPSIRRCTTRIRSAS